MAVTLFAFWPGKASAQGTSGPSASDSRVGYIDDAIPGTMFRFRFDDSFNDHRPTRAEFIYPKGAPAGPGLPDPQPSIDFQELSAYFEYAPFDRLSGFVEFPVRFLQTTVGADHAGFSDLNAGFKWAALFEQDTVGTFQFRVFAPTGNSHEGLGTHHTTLEPALLGWHRLTDRLTAEAEFRAWIPIGGTDFAGDILRYGVGLSYDLGCIGHVQFAPVLEAVGWTVLDGKTSVVPPDGIPFVEDAAGQTIVNIKFGLRSKFGDHADLYTGYGQALTGNRWYENTVRVEFRWLF
jgi:hypothetical protein